MPEEAGWEEPFSLNGNLHRERGMDFKDLKDKKISLVKCHWKVKKAASTIPSGYAFCCFESARLTREIEQKVEIIWNSYIWVFKAFLHISKENNKLYLHNVCCCLLNPELAAQTRREEK